MGDPRRFRRKYDSPKHPWEKTRIEDENRLIKEYALKTKKEIWRAKAKLRKYRHQARFLVGLSAEERVVEEKVLVGKLQKVGILPESGALDDILSLKVEDVLERRLQTLIWKKGLAQTAKQARQLIVHGHISVKGRKTTIPGMVIDKSMEQKIDWYGEPVKTPEPQTTLLKEPSETIEKITKEIKPTKGEKIDAKKVLKETGESETLKHISQKAEEVKEEKPEKKEVVKEKKPKKEVKKKEAKKKVKKPEKETKKVEKKEVAKPEKKAEKKKTKKVDKKEKVDKKDEKVKKDE